MNKWLAVESPSVSIKSANYVWILSFSKYRTATAIKPLFDLSVYSSMAKENGIFLSLSIIYYFKSGLKTDFAISAASRAVNLNF